MAAHLTKSGYVTAEECERKMWFNERDPLPPDPSDRYRMKQGQEVGERAREEFEGGIYIGGGTNAERVENTEQALAGEAGVLFEATFQHDRCLVRTDVLRSVEGGWELIEVKSTSDFGRKRDEIIPDVAFQRYVLGAYGLDVSSCHVMHLNGDCTYPDLDDLFVIRDVTEEVEERLEELGLRADHLQDVIEQTDAPEMDLMRACKRCRYRERCWGDTLPAYSIFSLPYVSWRHTDQYLDKGHRSIEDVRRGGTATEAHDLYLRAADNGGLLVDEEAVQARLGTLKYPLYFFDFETINPPIPRFPGTTPWQQIPFQYSVHRVDEPGAEPDHSEYLHDDRTDPREPLIESLIDDLGDEGSIVVYHKSFEGDRLAELAEAFPEYRDRLNSIRERLWDQEKFFSEYEYVHVDFHGRSSIKVVLPVLVPSISYEDLDVQDGTAAQKAYEEMIELAPGAERRTVRDQLLAYCERDTMAMVKIHRHLRGRCGV